jgi:hypothetical protein
MNAFSRNVALCVILILLSLALFSLFQNSGQTAESSDISFSQLLNEVDQGRVRSVVIQGQEIRGTFTDGHQFQTYAPNDPGLVQKLYQKNVEITVRPNELPWIVSVLISWLPIFAMIGVWIFLSRQMRSTGRAVPDFGDRARGMKAQLTQFALWIFIILLLLTLFTLFQNPSNRVQLQLNEAPWVAWLLILSLPIVAMVGAWMLILHLQGGGKVLGFGLPSVKPRTATPLSDHVRRVATVVDRDGKAVVLFDGDNPHKMARPNRNSVSRLLWTTNASPAPLSGADRGAMNVGIAPPAGGSIFRIVDFPPIRPEIEKLDPGQMHAELAADAPKRGLPPRHPLMHRTRTVDYAVVMAGEIDMLLDDSEIHLEAGDVLVQQGTNHAWINRGNAPCRIAFVLIDAQEP